VPSAPFWFSCRSSTGGQGREGQAGFPPCLGLPWSCIRFYWPTSDTPWVRRN